MTMARKTSRGLIDRLLGDASRLISHAEALAEQGDAAAARGEWSRAAETEEEAAGVLELVGDEVEAAVHRVSAASCYDEAGEHFRAITLLRAALAADLPGPYRERVAKQLRRTRTRASKVMEQQMAR